ncbi:MAG: SBBP repeat-containing protein [Acidobacteriia bacterium]|nr:SBBP repeat-containing protein [Terriglobia bacterium]
MDSLPLRFEPNQGQAPAGVQFLSRGHGYSLALTSTEASFQTGDALVRMKLVQANGQAQATPEGQLAGRSNYLLGNDRSAWRTGIPHYQRVRFAGVYPGIDLLYYGNSGQLEYDFIVQPGADASAIAMEFDGVRQVRVSRGDLILDTGNGEVRHKAPHIYQDRQAIQGSYRMLAHNRVGFTVAAYNRSRPLIIDPVLLFSTFYGGQLKDEAKSIGLDAQGNLYVGGLASSSDFPVTPGVVQGKINGSGNDIFVVKLNATGTQVLYSTLIGGNSEDSDASIAVYPGGEVAVGGTTTSTNFPTTGSAYQNSPRGGTDGFVLKLDAAGSALLFSTRIGGRGTDSVHGVSIDSSGYVYVTGETDSSDFPVTVDTYRTERLGTSDCFVVKFNQAGSALVYSTFIGGDSDSFVTPFESARAIAVDRFGQAHIGGVTTLRDFPITGGAHQSLHLGQGDAFVTKLNPSGTALVFSTFLGGEGIDQVNTLSLDLAGNIYAGGFTSSSRFPTTPQVFRLNASGGSEGWVAKLNANGQATYVTFLGGSGDDQVNGIASDGAGNAYVIGTTSSRDFPVSFDALQASIGTGSSEVSDAFITQLDQFGQTVPYSTYLGGSRNEIGAAIARDAMGNLYVAGYTQSSNFPVNPGALKKTTGFGTSTAFISRIGETLRAPSQIIIISGNFQIANQDAELGQLLVVEMRDQFNNPLRNLTVNFTALNAVLSAAAVNTDASGRAAVQVRLGNRPGAAIVTASFEQLPSAVFNLTVVRVGPPLPAISRNSVVGAANSIPLVRQISGGSIALVSGEVFAPAGVNRTVGPDDLIDGKLPNNFLGTCLTVNGVAARLFSVSSSQIKFQTPEDGVIGDARIVVITNCGQTGELRSDPETVQYLSSSPEFYSAAQSGGRSWVAATNALTGAVIAPPDLVPGAVAARPGDILNISGNGFGQTNPPVSTGEPARPDTLTVETPVVSLDGIDLDPANILFSGLTPGEFGIYQLRIRVPADVRNGNLRLQIRFSSQASPDTAYLRVAGGEDRAPRLAVSPARLDFGEVILNESRELPFTVANGGTSPLTISGFAINNPLFTVTPQFGLRLNPGEQRLLQVRFKPAEPGVVNASLTIRSDDESALELVIPLTGTGTGIPPVPNPAPVLNNVSPTAVDSGGGGFNLVVNGSGFVRTSLVQWNGQPRSTFFNHAGQLIAFITSIDIAAGGTAQVSVFSPAPGGGLSNEILFTVTGVVESGARLLISQFELRSCPDIVSYVSVLDANGQPVGGLPKTAVACTEDGEPVNCTATANPEAPLSLLIILGFNGLSTNEELSLMKSAATQLVNSLTGPDRVAIMHLETDARPLLDFTSDKDSAAGLIGLLRPVGEGNALLDGISLVPNIMRSEVRRRQAVVLITPSDTLSGILRDQSQVFGTSRALGAPFFNFAVGAGASNLNLTGFLRQLSRDTGGQLITESSPLNFGRMLQNVSNILKAQYRVEHTSRQLDAQSHILGLTFQTPGGAISGTRTFACTP